MSAWSPLRPVAIVMFALGCAKGLKPEAPVPPVPSVVAQARARPTVPIVRAKYRFKVQSEVLDLAGNTGGVLIAQRPDLAHLAILGPLGSPLVTVTADGAGIGVVLPRQSRQLVALDASRVLAETTGGALGADDLLAILLGDFPLADTPPTSEARQADGAVLVRWELERGGTVELRVEPVHATPLSVVARDGGGAPLLDVRYEPFVEDETLGLVPSSVVLRMEPIDLDIDLRFKSWEVLAEAPPVFSLRGPDDFVVESLEAVVRRGVERALLRAKSE